MLSIFALSSWNVMLHSWHLPEKSKPPVVPYEYIRGMHLVRGPCTTYKPPVHLYTCWLVGLLGSVCWKLWACSIRSSIPFPPSHCAESRCGWRASPACHLLCHSTILYNSNPSVVHRGVYLLSCWSPGLPVPWSVPGALILFYPAMFEINSILQITTFWSCDTIFWSCFPWNLLLTGSQTIFSPQSDSD